HQVAINVVSLAFMVPLGVAMATTVRIGQAAGRDDGPGVRAAARAGYGIVLGTQLLTATAMALAGNVIVSVYTDDPAIGALAGGLLLFAAVFQFPDGIQALSSGALRGLKDTTWPMIITALAYWGFGMPLGAFLGLDFGLGMGPRGMWSGLIAGLSAAAVMMTWRFLRLARRLPQPEPMPAHAASTRSSA